MQKGPEANPLAEALADQIRRSLGNLGTLAPAAMLAAAE
jgi:hypothetical protein